VALVRRMLMSTAVRRARVRRFRSTRPRGSHEPALVAQVRLVERPCVAQRRRLTHALALQLAQSREIVLDVLKGREHRAAVVGDLLVVGSVRGGGLCSVQAAVEERHQRLRTDRQKRLGALIQLEAALLSTPAVPSRLNTGK